jgi:hypothetical protein
MKHSVVVFVLALVSAFVSAVQDKSAKPESAAAGTTKPATAKVDTAKPIGALAWLVAGVWTSDASQLGPGMVRIETRYQWSDNHAFLRFNTHFVMKDGVIKNYDGNFFWNPAEASLAVWYMDAKNNITQGPVKVDGDNFQVSFRGTNFADKPVDLRVSVTRQSSDRYIWLLEEKTPTEWHQMAKLEYVRQAAE